MFEVGLKAPVIENHKNLDIWFPHRRRHAIGWYAYTFAASNDILSAVFLFYFHLPMFQDETW